MLRFAAVVATSLCIAYAQVTVTQVSSAGTFENDVNMHPCGVLAGRFYFIARNATSSGSIGATSRQLYSVPVGGTTPVKHSDVFRVQSACGVDTTSGAVYFTGETEDSDTALRYTFSPGAAAVPELITVSDCERLSFDVNYFTVFGNLIYDESDCTGSRTVGFYTVTGTTATYTPISTTLEEPSQFTLVTSSSGIDYVVFDGRDDADSSEFRYIELGSSGPVSTLSLQPGSGNGLGSVLNLVFGPLLFVLGDDGTSGDELYVFNADDLTLTLATEIVAGDAGDFNFIRFPNSASTADVGLIYDGTWFTFNGADGTGISFTEVTALGGLSPTTDGIVAVGDVFVIGSDDRLVIFDPAAGTVTDVPFNTFMYRMSSPQDNEFGEFTAVTSTEMYLEGFSPFTGVELYLLNAVTGAVSAVDEINLTSGMEPDRATLGGDGKVYFEGTLGDEQESELLVLDPATGAVEYAYDDISAEPALELRLDLTTGCGDFVVYQAETQSEGTEPHFYNVNTKAVTVIDLAPGSSDSTPENIFCGPMDTVYMSAENGDGNRNLWVAASGTTNLVEVKFDADDDFYPAYFVTVDSLVYFVGETEATGDEVFVHDPSLPLDATNPRLAFELVPGDGNGAQSTYMAAVDGVLYVNGRDDNLYAYDGSSPPTVVSAGIGRIGEVVPVRDQLLFNIGNTLTVFDIPTGTVESTGVLERGFDDMNLNQVFGDATNAVMLFVATVDTGFRQLFVYSKENGVELAADLFPGDASNPEDFINIGTGILFTARTPASFGDDQWHLAEFSLPFPLLDADFDGLKESEGDECPNTPLDQAANVDATGCSRWQLDRYDGDGVCVDRPVQRDNTFYPTNFCKHPDGVLTDNCPDVYNPTNVDSDSDGMGDACDIDGCHPACQTGCDPEAYVLWHASLEREFPVTLAQPARNSALVCTSVSVTQDRYENRCNTGFEEVDDSAFGCVDPAGVIGNTAGGEEEAVPTPVADASPSAAPVAAPPSPSSAPVAASPSSSSAPTSASSSPAPVTPSTSPAPATPTSSPSSSAVTASDASSTSSTSSPTSSSISTIALVAMGAGVGCVVSGVAIAAIVWHRKSAAPTAGAKAVVLSSSSSSVRGRSKKSKKRSSRSKSKKAPRKQRSGRRSKSRSSSGHTSAV